MTKTKRNDFTDGVLVGAAIPASKQFRVYRNAVSVYAQEELDLHASFISVTLPLENELDWPDDPSDAFIEGFLNAQRRFKVIPGLYDDVAITCKVSEIQLGPMTMYFVKHGVRFMSVLRNQEDALHLSYLIAIDDSYSIDKLLMLLPESVVLYYRQQLALL